MNLKAKYTLYEKPKALYTFFEKRKAKYTICEKLKANYTYYQMIHPCLTDLWSSDEIVFWQINVHLMKTNLGISTGLSCPLDFRKGGRWLEFPVSHSHKVSLRGHSIYATLLLLQECVHIINRDLFHRVWPNTGLLLLHNCGMVHMEIDYKWHGLTNIRIFDNRTHLSGGGRGGGRGGGKHRYGYFLFYEIEI